MPDIIQTVLTGNYRAVAAIKLAAFHLDDLLDLEVGAYADDGADRASLVSIAQQRVSEKYGRRFSRANTVIIGDTIHDVAAAHDGGAGVVAVANGSHDAEQLRAAGADTVLEDLTNTAALVAAITSTT